MYKIFKSIAFTSLLLIGATTACNLPSGSAPPKATELPAATATETMTPTVTPTMSQPTASATPAFAPFCKADLATIPAPAQCQMPIAVESSTFCTKKIPYNLLLLNKNAVYEVQTEGFKCADEGMKDGKRIVTCTGKMAAPFEVTVCDPTCAIPTVQADITQCPQGYYYNNLHGCCTQELQMSQTSCVTLKLKTTSCVVDCSGYTKKATCEKNSQWCVWNSGACETRK